jgi:hypothetical protein
MKRKKKPLTPQQCRPTLAELGLKSFELKPSPLGRAQLELMVNILYEKFKLKGVMRKDVLRRQVLKETAWGFGRTDFWQRRADWGFFKFCFPLVPRCIEECVSRYIRDHQVELELLSQLPPSAPKPRRPRRPKEGLRKQRYKKVQDRLRLWERRVRAAKKKVTEYRRRAKYYERVLNSNTASGDGPTNGS